MSGRRKSKTEKLLGVIIAASNDAADAISVFMTYKELKQRVYRGKKWPGTLSSAIHDMKKVGYLEVVEKDNQKAVRLTKKGWLKGWNPIINKEWDGRWRLVAFDIPEKRKKKRDGFRHALKMMGSIQMQKSLWICPYDVSEEIEELIAMLDIEENVDYFIADAITNKQKYIDMFGLNQ